MTTVLPPRVPSRRAPGPPFHTAIELHEAETAACLAIPGLRTDRVEIVSNVPPMAPR